MNSRRRRTFCFLSEVEMLKDAGLIKGGGLQNCRGHL